jgi:hypothetical protein
MLVLREAFPSPEGWDQPAALRQALWTDSKSRAILVAVEELALALPEVIASQRKGFSAWSRQYQFAALRPARGGVARLGLALTPDADPALLPAGKEGWSERLKAVLILESPRDANKRLATLLKAAWAAS